MVVAKKVKSIASALLKPVGLSTLSRVMPYMSIATAVMEAATTSIGKSRAMKPVTKPERNTSGRLVHRQGEFPFPRALLSYPDGKYVADALESLTDEDRDDFEYMYVPLGYISDTELIDTIHKTLKQKLGLKSEQRRRVLKTLSMRDIKHLIHHPNDAGARDVLALAMKYSRRSKVQVRQAYMQRVLEAP